MSHSLFSSFVPLIACLTGICSAPMPDSSIISRLRSAGCRLEVDSNQAEKPVMSVLWNRKYRVADSDLNDLAAMGGLQHLDLRGTDISDDTLSILPRFQSLTTLNLSETNITVEGVKHLKGLASLECLILNQTKLSLSDLNCLADLPRLNKLVYVGEQLSHSDFLALSAFEHLDIVELAGKVTAVDLRPLAQMRSLSNLSLGFGYGSTSTVRALEGCGRLRRLSLFNIDPRQLADLQWFRLANVTELDLSGAHVTTTLITALLGLQRLEKLCLRDCSIDSRHMVCLSRLRTLRSLVLDNSSVSATNIGLLSQISGLEELSLYKARVDERLLAEITQLSQIKRLDLTHVNTFEQGLEPIAVNFSGCQGLRSLNLDNAGRQLKLRGVGLTHLRSLEEVSLRRSKISGEGIEALSHLDGLKHLDLSYSDLSDNDMASP